jgi:hypothetical protein
MCLALEVLGYKDVYHCMKVLDKPTDWQKFGEASDALFQVLPTYNAKGMTTEDWDELFRQCEAICDIAGPFGESLIQSYPNAKVVLVLRDFERWEPSVKQLLDGNFGRAPSFVRDYIEPLIGTTYTVSIQKFLLGWTQCKDVDEIKSRLREHYDRHHAMVRRMVPKDQLLEYRLGSGWEPLCAFLEKDIPDEPFPHGNEAEALRKVMLYKKVKSVAMAGWKVSPYIAAVAAVGASAWYTWDTWSRA